MNDWQWRVMVAAWAIAAAACDDAPPRDDGGADAADDAGHDAAADGGGDADADGSPPPPHHARALVLDHELRGSATWADVVEALRDAGLEVVYRRYYPHLTAADVERGADGRFPFALVVMAAGRTPGSPASLARRDEIATARAFVEGGGALVLVPQSGYRDSVAGENDFFVHNRILEELGVPVRTERDTVVGVAWAGDPQPPHQSYQWGYATPLEFVIGYPYLLTRGDEARVAGGMMPTLRVASAEVDVLLRTYDVGLRWVNAEGDPDARIEYIEGFTPAATLARARGGWVAVVPRGPLTVTAASAISDKPAYDPERVEANRAWVRDLARRLRGLVLDGEPFEVGETHEGDPLFSVRTLAIAPLDPDGEVYMVGSGVSDLAVADTPPPGRLADELPPPPDGARVVPAWFSPSGGRLAYGGPTPARADMAAAFDEVVAHGVDVLMTTTNPARLLGLTGSALAAERAMYAEIAALAEDAGAAWFVGEHYVGPFLADEPRAHPLMRGSHGGEADAPAPLADSYWDEAILPTCATVGELAAASPGIAGFHLDFELYGGPVWHHDGWAFSDDTVAAFRRESGDDALADALTSARPADRLALLVDGGRLADYFDALEAATATRATDCRRAIRDLAPEVELTFYVPGFPDTWFYRGIARGFAEPGRPATALSYDAWSETAVADLRADGIELAHLGGFIVGHFRPEEMREVITSMVARTDGYWYFTFNDFSATNPAPPRLHGAPAEYWSAVDEAHARLD